MTKQHIQKIVEFAATLSCLKGRKPNDCQCPPCLSRQMIFGGNYMIVQQETMRERLSKLEKELKNE